MDVQSTGVEVDGLGTRFVARIQLAAYQRVGT